MALLVAEPWPVRLSQFLAFSNSFPGLLMHFFLHLQGREVFLHRRGVHPHPILELSYRLAQF